MKVTLIMVMTADGLIAKHAGHAATWSSNADKQIFKRKTKEVGVMVMGLTTYQTINRPLTERLIMVMCLPGEAGENIPGQVEYTTGPPKRLMRELIERGFKEVVVAGGATINGLFLNEDLIDELWLTIEPRIFGRGMSLFNVSDSVDKPLMLIESEQLNRDVMLLKYTVVKQPHFYTT